MSQAYMLWKRAAVSNNKNSIIAALQNNSKFLNKKKNLAFQKWRALIQRGRMVSQCLAIQKIIKLDIILQRILKKKVMEVWRRPRFENPWFRRVAQMIAKNSRINVQVSYWRMRDSSFTQGNSLKTLKIIKFKKLLNVIRKLYERNLTMGLTAIESFGKAEGSFQ